jgi:hypothetical protein
MTRARLSTLAAGLLLWPAVASACPACAGNQGLGTRGLITMGLMIALPFAVVALIVPVLRRGPSDPTQ